MGKVETKNLDKPDETRSFSNGVVEMVTVGGKRFGRSVFQPGWRWSNDVKPIAGTDRCMFTHQGYVVAGSAVVQAEDGSETTLSTGDVYLIEPGHDAWVIGDEAWITVDVAEGMEAYARPTS